MIYTVSSTSGGTTIRFADFHNGRKGLDLELVYTFEEIDDPRKIIKLEITIPEAKKNNKKPAVPERKMVFHVGDDLDIIKYMADMEKGKELVTKLSPGIAAFIERAIEAIANDNIGPVHESLRNYLLEFDQAEHFAMMSTAAPAQVLTVV